MSSAPQFSAVSPDAWLLDAAVAFLNHGSFGACAHVVLERQTALRKEMERQPVDFFVRRLPPLMDDARNALAALIGAVPADLAFVPNATTGVNAVLRSLEFRPGDEILVTAHDYNACRNVVRYLAKRTGIKAVEVNIPLPIASPRQVVDAVLERVTPRTRIAMLDHVTSPTAVIFPIEELVRELDRRGVDVLVDGAHAPGMIPLDLDRIGAAYYTGNCHKWLCAPKGAGFLHVRRDRRQGIQPTTISHGWNQSRQGYSPLQDAFDWPGTTDPTAWLCVGESIRFVSTLMEGGLPALMQRNHELAVLGQNILCRRHGITAIAPEAMLGSMAAVRLPDDEPEQTQPETQSPAVGGDWLHDRLRERHHIEVPTFYWPAAPQRLLRISAQAYNHPPQYERLAQALEREVLMPKTA